jgi:hypothetical protein
MLLVTSKPIPLRGNLKPLDVYLFDCMGLVVLRNVFPASQIEAAKKAIDAVHPGIKPWKFPVLNLGEVFWDMMTNPTMLALVEQLCGDQFRMDHAFSVSSDAGLVNLHGGPSSSFGSCFTQVDNQLMTGQLSCGVSLAAQSPATGGMCYIPGSHRSLDMRTGSEVRKQLLNGRMDHECITIPTLNPGDLVVFSESLVHGDTGWNNPGYSRIITYYKFCPGFMTWRDPREQEQYVPLARTDLERRLVEPPWSGKFSDKNNKMDYNNTRREKTLS